MKNGLIVDDYGTRRWFLNGEFHREDGPTIEWADGPKHWYLNDQKYSEEEYEVEIQKLKDERIKQEERLKEIRSFNYKLESLKL